MASIQDYLKIMSTHQLKAILREECEGRGDLPVEVVLAICDLLAERDPALPPASQILRQLCRGYLAES